VLNDSISVNVINPAFNITSVTPGASGNLII